MQYGESSMRLTAVFLEGQLEERFIEDEFAKSHSIKLPHLQSSYRLEPQRSAPRLFGRPFHGRSNTQNLRVIAMDQCGIVSRMVPMVLAVLQDL
eukprot:2241366-Amphidinium_carterae.1